METENLTILVCDRDIFAFKNEIDDSPQLAQVRKIIDTVGNELHNSLFCEEPPRVLVYEESSARSVDYREVSDSDLENVLESDSVNFAVYGISENDWASTLIYISGDANAQILALGYHPSFEVLVRQIYDSGELDTGIIEDPDIDTYGSNKVTEMFNAILRIHS